MRSRQKKILSRNAQQFDNIEISAASEIVERFWETSKLT
jgi:hypothetical protein